jgi:hypothetical protein
MGPNVESGDGRIASPSCSAVCWLLVLVSVSLSFARLMQAQPLQSANDRSRWCTVRALVEQGTYRIDDVRRLPGWDTIDLVRHEGHFYSTKPPLLSTLVGGLYWCVRHTIGWDLDQHLAATTRLILVIVNLVPWAIALIVLTRLVRKSTTSAFTQVFVVATACFGTLLLPFLVSLNNHTPAAVCVVFALAPAVSIIGRGRREWWRFAATGFWSGLAFTNELPAAALVAALGAALLLIAPKKTLRYGLPAMLVPVAVFLALNRAVTGDWLSFYASYNTAKYRFVFEGVPSYWSDPRGIDQALDSPAVYLLHCTIGHHGVFSLTPVWLLAVAGWAVVLWVRRKQGTGVVGAAHAPADSSAPTPETTRVPVLLHAIGFALTLIVFGYFLTKTDHYNYGGVSVALRWLLWLTPFWLLALVPLLDACGSRWWLRGFACVCLAVSVYSAWLPFDGPWKQPWIFTLMEDAGWIDYRDRRPEFSRPVYSWVFALPQEGQRHDDYWIELSARDADGGEWRLRLQDGGPAEVDGLIARKVDVTLTGPGDTARAKTHWIDVAAFTAGQPPAKFVLWPAGSPAERERQAAYAFWHGVPQPARYSSLIDRYLRLPALRRDAFRCRQAYARVRSRQDRMSEPYSYRRDVWFCNEFPFGVAQFENQVIDRSNTIVSRQRWQAIAVGRLLHSGPAGDPP